MGLNQKQPEVTEDKHLWKPRALILVKDKVGPKE